MQLATVRAIAVICLIGLAVVANACSTEDPTKVAALNQEGMADLQLPGAVRIDRREIQAESGIAKPGLASILQVYRPEASTLVEVEVAALKAAEAAGWKMEDLTTAWQGRKSTPAGTVKLGVSTSELDGQDTVVVSLRIE